MDTTPMAMAEAERGELAELLATLTPEQWAAPSLCAGWTVREVVAHAFSYEELGLVGLLGRFVRSGLTPDRVNARGVAAHADDDPGVLLARVRRNLRPRGLTRAFGGRVALTDAVIHHQDIRRPLGLPRTVPTERLRVALEFASWAPPIRAAARIRGLRLVATDVDWAKGHGPEVTGAGEPLLMAVAGREEAVDELSGPGRAILAERIGR